MQPYRYSPGDQPIDGYSIEHGLGRGGFGEVYFATTQGGRDVALKAILNHEDIELRGVRNCMNLQSPRLMHIFDVKHDSDGVPWLIMEFIRGPSLQDIIRDSPTGIGVEQSLYLLREVSLGLSELHHAGIVHRDLKPSNIFFEGGFAKIGDYSLSKSIACHEQSRHTLTVGSVHYMAPEISLGRYGKSVDIYSLGVILFEMLTGRPPHTGESVGEILLKHLHADVDVSPIEEPLRHVVSRAMSRNPDERYVSAEALVRDALATIDPTSLVDSFCPATLSLIGERALEQKQRDASATHGDSGHKVAKTTPQVLAACASRGAAVDAAPKAISPERRIAHATALVLATTLIGISIDNRGGLGVADYLRLSVSILLAASTFAYALFRWPTTKQAGVSSRVSRGMIAVLGASVLTASATCLTHLEFEGVFVSGVATALTLGFIDWRKQLTLDRDGSNLWLPTLVSAVTAFGLCHLLRMPEWSEFASTTVLGVTLALQAIAPVGQCDKDSQKPLSRRLLATWIGSAT